MAIVIEDAKKTDMEACKEIFLIVWDGIHGVYADLIGEELHDVFFDNWQGNVDNGFVASFVTAMGENRAFVAKDEDKVVGFAYYRALEEHKTANIGYSAVRPEYKKKGIGSMLYQKMMDSMKAEGFQYVSVSTGLDDAHAPARKAYERAGFQKNLPSVRYFQKLQ